MQIKTCGTCACMLDDGDGSSPYCAWRDLYYNVTPDMLACEDWRSRNGNELMTGFLKHRTDVNRGLDDVRRKDQNT